MGLIRDGTVEEVSLNKKTPAQLRYRTIQSDAYG